MLKISSLTTGKKSKKVREGDHYTWHSWTNTGDLSNAFAIDLVEIAKAVFLTDRFERRHLKLGQRRRNLEVEIPVSNPSAWNQVLPQIEEIASFSTDDNWRIVFTQASLKKNRTKGKSKQNDIVALFSGGIDSACGAAYLAQGKCKPIFVTHSPPGQDKAPELLEKIWNLNGRQDFKNIGLAVFKLNPDTQIFSDPLRRSRPFYYLALALAVALDNGISKVQMSENGAMALSLPSRSDSYGAMRTRQAHRFTRAGFEGIMNIMAPELAPWEIENPFEYNTKGEASEYLTKCDKLIHRFLSCEYVGQQSGFIKSWKKTHSKLSKSWKIGIGPQCGICEPCICRRAALKRAGLKDPDSDYYFNAKKVIAKGNDIKFKTRTNQKEFKSRPPLYDKVASHALWIARYCKKILAMDSFAFGVKYLPELRKYPYPNNLSPTEIDMHHKLLKRFSKEILDFLNVRK